MKCQKCGKNEVNLHYSENINGQVSQAFLCSDCAAELGYGFDQNFGFGSMLDEFFPVFGRLGGSGTIGLPGFGIYSMFPGLVPIGHVGPAKITHTGGCNCGDAQCTPDSQGVTVDEEMKKRREINMLHEQMRLAAEKDDFENAIELREKIKEMEKGLSQS